MIYNSQQPLLSDEQAAEIEELLLTADRDQQSSADAITTTTSTTTTNISSSSNTAAAPLAADNETEPDWLQNVLDASKLAEAPLPPLPPSAVAAHFDIDRRISDTYAANHAAIDESASMLDASMVSVDSLAPSSVADDSSSRLEQNRLGDGVGSGAGSFISLSTNNSEATINDPDVFFIPEYPPVSPKEVFVEGGIHYFEDGNFWMEIPGLMECDDDDDDLDYPVFQKRNTKVRFSSGTIQVFSTYSVNDYDRRNEDVDPVAASAEYELEKRVEKMHVFPVELMKGPEGLGLSIIGESTWNLFCSSWYLTFNASCRNGSWCRCRIGEARHFRENHNG